MSKLKQKRILEGLLAAHSMITYARKLGAFATRGGDHYIEQGELNRALCEALDLDHNAVTVEEFEQAISDTKKRLRRESGWGYQSRKDDL
jgi:hypothetical protein